MNKSIKFWRVSVILLYIVTGMNLMYAQNRGNNMAFQGYDNPNENSARALGMGSAYTAMSGDINALYYNPAGLSGMQKLSLNVNGGSLSRKWTENQVYYPNRLLMTLPFYLEGLYIPDPANNGKLDNEIFFDGLLDTAYVVSRPDTGLDSYSDKAADWLKKQNSSGFNSLAIAFPMQLAGKNIVLSASWNKDRDLYSYDRNNTYLDPHIGYSAYHMPHMVDGSDTIRMNWSVFERERTGSMNSFRGAIAAELTENINIGFSINRFSGETKDLQSLNKVGRFELYDENSFAFWYDTLNYSVSGISTFSGTKPELGILLDYEAFDIGLNIRLPYMVNRDFKYKTVINDTSGTMIDNLSGVDKMKVPLSYAFGVQFRPTKYFIFSLDYDRQRYQKAEFELASTDTTHRDWADKNILRFGIQYNPVKMLALRAGYRTIPQVFIPDGTYFRDRGPEARAWTLGVGLNFGALGSVDAAWEYRILKYFDQYYSNVNYCKEIVQNLLISYQYQF